MKALCALETSSFMRGARRVAIIFAMILAMACMRLIGLKSLMSSAPSIFHITWYYINIISHIFGQTLQIWFWRNPQREVNKNEGNVLVVVMSVEELRRWFGPRQRSDRLIASFDLNDHGGVKDILLCELQNTSIPQSERTTSMWELREHKSRAMDLRPQNITDFLPVSQLQRLTVAMKIIDVKRTTLCTATRVITPKTHLLGLHCHGSITHS
jgi:hypothetical protein